jgi:hypothetical protein
MESDNLQRFISVAVENKIYIDREVTSKTIHSLTKEHLIIFYSNLWTSTQSQFCREYHINQNNFSLFLKRVRGGPHFIVSIRAFLCSFLNLSDENSKDVDESKPVSVPVALPRIEARLGSTEKIIFIDGEMHKLLSDIFCLEHHLNTMQIGLFMLST